VAAAHSTPPEAGQLELQRITQEKTGRAAGMQIGPVVARAIKRGEAPSGTGPLAVGRTLSVPLLTRVLVTGEAIDNNAAAEAAGIAATAARSGALTPPGAFA
jgi:hypothetical protein